MEKIKKNIKFLGIFIIMALMLSFVSIPVSATEIQDAANSTAGKVIIEQVFLGGGKLLNKVFGLNPIVHGVLAGGFSAINTFSQLSKVEIDFSLDRDQVNLSEDKEDYFEPYDNYLLDNKIEQDVTLKDNMLLTDKNILDAQFIETKNLSEIDNGSNSPNFRLADKTKLVKVLDSNNQAVSLQKREILFEDTNKTIENEYEYRTFVVKYPKSTYTGKVDYDLGFSDLLGSWANLLVPFYNGASNIKISKFLDGSNTKLIDKINEEKKEEILLEPFKLIFNSYVRDSLENVETDQVNCVTEGGLLLGQTGTEALPNIALDWTYNSSTAQTISGRKVSRLDWCDADLTGEDNKESIFCDSTQFSIELLNKLEKIQNFVKDNKPSFTCPTPGVTQSLISENNNIGITQLNSSYDSSIISVEYLLEGTMNLNDFNIVPERFGNLALTLFKDGVEEDSKIIEFTLEDFIENKFSGTEEFDVGFIFDDETNFSVTAILTLSEPYSSVDSKLDNLLENEFTPNSETCDLEKTSQNINLFSKNKKIDTSLVEFRSYLMKDGYSNDFKADFDRYYRYTITAAPDIYKDYYYKYFTTDNFTFQSSFDSEPGRLVLQGPGRYNVLLKVTFDDEWNLFDKTTDEVTGKVEVILTREIAPERDSPLYYMPFNGLVGIDSENARQGYGVDFTGDVVTVSKLQTNEYLRTEPFTQSNTVNTVSVKEYGKNPTDFSFLNNGQTRGMLLNINLSSTKTNPELVFVPSRATPVALKVSNQNNDAYAFYKLDIGAPQAQGGEPALTPGSLVPWTGVGNCLDFTGISILETYKGRPDIHAISSKLAPSTTSDTVSYGVEWEGRNITRRGDVFLRTVFYTPSNFKTGDGLSVLTLDSYDDAAAFYTLGQENASSVELRNVLGNNADIKYISEIFSLVNEKKACIDYTANNLKISYNPIAVSEPLFGGDLSSDSQNAWVESKGGCIIN
jgi:hypothetical protein